jgi:hypothetical protein
MTKCLALSAIIMHLTSLLTRRSTVGSEIGFTPKHLMILFNGYYS